MKKTLLIAISLFTVLGASAQQFWFENWAGSNAQGQLIYSDANGTWTVAKSGANGADSNAWYFSTMEGGQGRNVCGAAGPTATAHVGYTANAPLLYSLYLNTVDQGAVIDDGNGNPTNTNLRLQSPTINCTGKTNIKISFNYIMGSAPGNDSATLVYSANNGSTWSTLSGFVATDTCAGQGGQSLWKYFSIALPVSANGNATVKIGFNWVNNSAGYADNYLLANNEPLVSFAVDSIQLIGSPILGVNQLADDGKVTIYPNPSHGVFQLEISNYQLGINSSIEIYNVLGERVYSTSFTTNNSPYTIDMSSKPAGVYMYRVLSESGELVSEGKFIIE